MNSTNFQQLFMYVFIVLVSGVAAYLKLIDPTIFVGILLAVAGHAAGANIPVQPQPKEAPALLPPASASPPAAPINPGGQSV